MAMVGDWSRFDVEEHGVEALWAGRRPRRTREGDGVRSHLEGIEDRWVRGATKFDDERGHRFRDERSQTHVSAVLNGERSLPSAPLVSDLRAKNVLDFTVRVPYQILRRDKWSTTGDVSLPVRVSRSNIRRSGRQDSIDDYRDSKTSRYFPKIADYYGVDDFGIQIFDGSSGMKEVVAWIQEVDDLFTNFYVPPEKQAKLVSISFRGYASLWWEQIQNQRIHQGKRPILSWARMKRRIEESFPLGCSYNMQSEEYHSRKPNFKRISDEENCEVEIKLETIEFSAQVIEEINLELIETKIPEKDVQVKQRVLLIIVKTLITLSILSKFQVAPRVSLKLN
ncbi:hypothetical protein TorRG33x02_090910 [Trema orientale]|uniref:Retrotransposon gag domain-containing protein n=1 Tax=Trema orientale TaxID=63057 RepID=A0A2P5FBM7_TREOI|nr:hypothetical protein TorRG33x02_090910 [Trema orientale]